MPTPVHFRYLFSTEEAFLVLHPLSPKEAQREVRSMPVYTIETFGPAIAVRQNDKQLLFNLLREEGFSICRKCHRAEYCPVLTWDHEWLGRTGLSLVQAFATPVNPPQWKVFFDDLYARFAAKNTAVNVAESILGLRPPYTQAQVTHAYRREALAKHPDRGGSAEAFDRVKKAYNTLLANLS